MELSLSFHLMGFSLSSPTSLRAACPSRWLLRMLGANPAPTQVVSRPLAVKQSRGVCICTADLMAFPVTRMAPVVNKLLRRDNNIAEAETGMQYAPS